MNNQQQLLLCLVRALSQSRLVGLEVAVHHEEELD
jgi:hypothetical protein